MITLLPFRNLFQTHCLLVRRPLLYGKITHQMVLLKTLNSKHTVKILTTLSALTVVTTGCAICGKIKFIVLHERAAVTH